MSKIIPEDSDFDWLANIYNTHGAINHPSELHGILLGQLAGGHQLDQADRLTTVLEHMGVEELDEARLQHVKADLGEFYEAVGQEVDKDSSALRLLLPDDDYPLTERVDALAQWVRGFLEGLAIAASDALAKIDADLQEMLRDLVEISQLDARVEASEEGEKELFEVCEYVRIAVLNIYAEFNQPGADTSESHQAAGKTLH